MPWSDRIGSRLKLRDLHIFMVVATAGTMGRAAAELAVSQPVISKAIADLEYALGVRLFDRSRRGSSRHDRAASDRLCLGCAQEDGSSLSKDEFSSRPRRPRHATHTGPAHP